MQSTDASNLATQMKLQQIAAEKNKIATSIVEKKMKEEYFPVELLTKFWIDNMREAIKDCHPMSQKATLKDFVKALAKMHKAEPRLTMTEFQIVANSLDAVSMNQLGLDVEDYERLCNETFGLVETWSKKINVINDEAKIEAEREYQKKNNGASGLKPIIGEA